ncbi:MAG: recombinase family protein [Minisyncoccia bacterium]
MNQNKVAVIYCRVSTDEQAKEGLSIESQELTCRRKAEEEGYSVIEVIKDEGKSGKNINREGMKNILRLVNEKKINAIYLVNTDRLSRNVADHIYLTDLFRKNKVLLRSINQPTLDSSATSITMDLMMATMNQFQRLNTAEKVKSTMHEKAKAGYYPSKAPVGYKNVQDLNKSERFARKTIIIDEKAAVFVREIFRLYATGEHNAVEVSDIVYDKGFRSRGGKKVSDSKIYMMLKNRFYIGEINWGEIHIPKAKHEPLIERVVFDQVQSVLNSHNKHSCRRRKYKWLLSGFLRCHKHNSRYTAEWHLNKKIAYYHCTVNGCGKFSEQVKLENAIAEKFKDLEFSPDFIELVISKAKNIFYERREVYESKRQGLINQKSAFEAKLKVAETKLLSGTLKDEDFKRIREEIKKEIDLIDNRIVEVQKGKEINVDMTREIIGLTKNIFETYQKALPELKRLFLGFFWERFEVSEGIIINSIPSILFSQLIKLEKAYQKSQNTNKPSDFANVISSTDLSPHLESNQDFEFRKLMSYPLNDEEMNGKTIAHFF